MAQGNIGVGSGASGGGGAGGGLLRIDTSRVRENNESSPIRVVENGNGGVDGGGIAQDSLSLLQLKRLVGEGGRVVQPEYAFVYTPSESLPTELNEWFSYSTAELSLVIGGAKQTFDSIYTELSLPPHRAAPPLGKRSRWSASKDVKRRRFISRCLDLMDHAVQEERVKGLEGISFIAQGAYGELHHEHEQLDSIKRNVKLLRKSSVVEGVFNCLRKSLSREWGFGQQATAAANGSANGKDPEETLNQKAWNRRELKQAMTVMYFLIETTRLVSEEESEDKGIGFDLELEAFRDELSLLPHEGGLLGYLLTTIARVRWEDNVDLPLMHLLLLAWKTALLQFGSIQTHLPKVKSFARVSEGLSPEVDKTLITASPLDYHMFRQDIIAKYPAYNPPKSLFAFDGPSFLPSLTERERESRTGGNTDLRLGGKGSVDNLTSIFDKAVHIATPAPSPPPSPIPANGKVQKKHNYQTNQNFPFLYPPSSGEGADARFSQDAWWKDDGGGVPTSIKEAGDLFSKRLRTTLAMRQLWKEREAYERVRRGWETGEEEQTMEGKWERDDQIPRWEEERLAAVDEVYATILPQLQSLVIVMFKVMLQSIAVQSAPPPPPPPPPQNTFAGEDELEKAMGKQVVSDPAMAGSEEFAPSASLRNSWNIFGKGKGREGSSLGTIDEGMPDAMDWEKQRLQEKAERDAEEKKHWEEIDNIRLREITSKAVTALLLVLLKWFRASHVLKFEYMTQLLLDSNYIPLVLKILNQQDVVATLTSKFDRPERAYFRICNLHSLSPHPLPSSTESSSPDESAPPPILRFGRDPPPSDDPPLEQPPEMITEFSWRNFFTSTNLMRVLQKVVKGKAHRNLALVQYKSSMLLRKPLKCPQTDLRLYTLKVFKGQVPYCGRKWRQSNMRVITSIYLYCRPELRDDWLAGSDVDEEVEEALPQEHSLRALTQFYNVRRWPKKMGVTPKHLEDERDFFARELERMSVFARDEVEGEDVAEWAEGVWS